MKNFILITLLLICCLFAQAADRYWIGTDNDWSNNNNWSTSSGGPSDGLGITTADAAVFDGTNNNNCIIPDNTTIEAINIKGTYTGNITIAGSGNLTINSDFTQEGGSFTGSSGDINISGVFQLSGGSFTAPSSGLKLNNAVVNISGGAFDNATGVVVFLNSIVSINLLTNFYNADIRGTMVLNTLNADMFIVTNTLDYNITGQFTGTGTINASGNINLGAASPTPKVPVNLAALMASLSPTIKTATLKINGASDQQLNSLDYSYTLPHVLIDKPTGTLFLQGGIIFEGGLAYNEGIIDYTTYPNFIGFALHNSPAISTNSFALELGSVVIGNGSLANPATPTALTLPGTQPVIITGNALLSSAAPIVFSGTGNIEFRGDLDVSAYTNTATANNTSTFRIGGTADQTITGVPNPANVGHLPNIDINKPGGTLYISQSIGVEGNWSHTDGTIGISGLGTPFDVVFFGNKTIASGDPGGATFYNVILGDINQRTLIGDIIIANSFDLGNGKLNTNGYEIQVNNSNPNAIIRNTGYIISEQTNNSGKITWDISTDTAPHTFPLGTVSGDYIPFIFKLNSGDANQVTISTYPTAADNTPYPTSPQAITNLAAFGQPDNSANVVNRFWQISSTGDAIDATVTFTYADTEFDGAEPADYVAQRWDAELSAWDAPLPGQTRSLVNNQVTCPNVTEFSPWTLVREILPLPIELIGFTAKKCGDAICLNWSTAKEKNNDYFDIERSFDNSYFSKIGTMKGSVNTTNISNYSFRDQAPYNGLAYYRLKQTDLNGSSTYSAVRAIEYSNTDEFSIRPNPNHGTFNLSHLNITEGLNISCMIYSSNGALVYSSTVQSGEPVNTSLPQGFYTLITYIGNQAYTRKLIIY